MSSSSSWMKKGRARVERLTRSVTGSMPSPMPSFRYSGCRWIAGRYGRVEVRAALVDDAAQLALDVGIVGRDHAAFARGDLLVRVEAVDGRVSERPQWAAADARAERLACVLHHRETMLGRDRRDRADLAGVS